MRFGKPQDQRLLFPLPQGEGESQERA
jgi:hypothetical protein